MVTAVAVVVVHYRPDLLVEPAVIPLVVRMVVLLFSVVVVEDASLLLRAAILYMEAVEAVEKMAEIRPTVVLVARVP